MMRQSTQRRQALQSLMLVGFVCVMVAASCTRHECNSTKDCLTKGDAYRCVPQDGFHLCLIPQETTQCVPVCKASERCNKGRCEASSLCQSDDDCATNERCQEGSCLRVCVCVFDEDCATDGSQACVDCTCQAKPKAIQCATDRDCALSPDRPRCLFERGECVSCLIDADCPSTDRCSANNQCHLKTNCCRNDLDCHTGERCSQCACKPIAPASGQKAGDPCSQSNPCGDGYDCYIDQDGSACLQACRRDDNCANHAFRTHCRVKSVRLQLPNGKRIQVQRRYCLGISKAEGSCGLIGVGKRQGECQEDQQTPLYCEGKSNTCKEALVRTKEGEPCGHDASPSIICDKAKGLHCDPKRGVCQKVSFAKEGYPCDDDGSLTGAVVLCETGQCLAFDKDYTLKRCQRLCNPNEGKDACPEGTGCVTVIQNVLGFCLQQGCNTAQDCKTPDSACLSDSHRGSFCWPRHPAGPKLYGEICQPPWARSGCNTDPQAGGSSTLFCLRPEDASAGMCSQGCSATRPCPLFTTKAGVKIQASCVQLTAFSSRVCIFPCGFQSQSCPEGMHCKEIGGTYCMP